MYMYIYHIGAIMRMLIVAAAIFVIQITHKIDTHFYSSVVASPVHRREPIAANGAVQFHPQPLEVLEL